MASTDETGTHETDAAVGTRGESVPPPVPAVQPDTTEAGRVDASGWEPTPTGMTATPDTLMSTVTDVLPPYKPSAGPVPGTVKDTTRTDSPVGNGTGSAVPNPLLSMTETLETAAVGAAPLGSTDVPAAPNAPAVVSGDRHVTVSWAAVADPAPDAPVLGYVVESDSGGHSYAGRDATSERFENVTGGRAQRFRVRAENRNGTGPYSAWSAASVSPGNEDLIPPGAIPADNAVNPIYNQDGTIKHGSWGAPTPPTGLAVAPEGTSGTATVTWSASTPEPLNYTVKASSGQEVTVAGTATSADVPGLTVSEDVTFTVTAVAELQDATSDASAPYTVV